MDQVADAISHVSGEKRWLLILSVRKRLPRYAGRIKVPEEMIGTLTSMYRAVDNGEFETVTDHVEKITGKLPERIEAYLQRTYNV